jgi:hypothetical protein
MSALHRRPIALSLSFSLAPRSLPSGPALPRSCSSATFARFAHGRRPPLFARQQRRPHPTVGIRCRPPCASDSRASPPPPPPPTSTWTHPRRPPFSSLPAPPSCFSKAPPAAPLPSLLRPLPELEHRHPPCTRCKLTRPISSTERRATPPIWEPPLPPPRPHGELRLPGFSSQISSATHFPSVY